MIVNKQNNITKRFIIVREKTLLENIIKFSSFIKQPRVQQIKRKMALQAVSVAEYENFRQ